MGLSRIWLAIDTHLKGMHGIKFSKSVTISENRAGSSGAPDGYLIPQNALLSAIFEGSSATNDGLIVPNRQKPGPGHISTVISPGG
ncbi:MAG TPA: hypothetical protein VF523_08415, partial [Burkholderiales bacterium]